MKLVATFIPPAVPKKTLRVAEISELGGFFDLAGPMSVPGWDRENFVGKAGDVVRITKSGRSFTKYVETVKDGLVWGPTTIDVIPEARVQVEFK